MAYYHGQVAEKVRLEKEQHPDRFCKAKGCLWKITKTPCSKHPSLLLTHALCRVCWQSVGRLDWTAWPNSEQRKYKCCACGLCTLHITFVSDNDHALSNPPHCKNARLTSDERKLDCCVFAAGETFNTRHLFK